MKHLPFFGAVSSLIFLNSLVVFEVTASSSTTTDEQSTATTAANSIKKVEPWAPISNSRASATDLHREYNNIFRHGNRNAASHKWSSFLLDRSDQMTESQLIMFFSAFCAVSGSPVRPSDYNRYRLTLPMVPKLHQTEAEFRTGYMHYCCWPCVCDTQDFIRIDTKTIELIDGPKEFTFAVIGNPCDHPEELTKPFVQPFYGRQETTIEQTAPEVRCNRETGALENATLSDNGYIIISMFFDSQDAKMENGVAPNAQEPLPDPTPGRISTVTHVDSSGRKQFQDEREYQHQCLDRANNGYNSGMGEIFRKVSAISPIPTSLFQELPNAESDKIQIEIGNQSSLETNFQDETRLLEESTSKSEEL